MSDNGDYIKDYMENIGYLISCNSATRCEKLSSIANNGYYINAGISVTNNPLILFDADTPEISEQSPDNKDVYYLDSSTFGTTTYSSLIYCSTLKNCTSIIPDDGYFYNSGSLNGDSDAIIECDKVGCKINKVQLCTADESKTLKPGNYCYQREADTGTDMNFIIKEFIINSENLDVGNQNITYSSSYPLYRYVSVNAGNFPGIIGTVSTLFQIKSNSITRVMTDGVFIINSKYEKVDSINGSISVSSAFTIYTCSSATQICTPSQTCEKGTYLLDEDNNRGYQCNGNSITPILEAGYYVDSSYVVDKNNTPAIMKCQSSGECKRYKPSNAYFLNAGIDNYSRPLIYCSGRSCSTQEATVGYYRAEFGESGVIACTSTTSCKRSNLRYNYYINSGEDKMIKPIIACTKNVICNTKKANSGYYLIQNNSNLLINCNQPTNCQMENGSIGYYFNAENMDSSTDAETIINCVASTYTSETICSTEKRNNGFYLSGSSNNILVDCSGGKCKSIEVQNGIFCSAGGVSKTSKSAFNKGRDAYDDYEEDLGYVKELQGELEVEERNVYDFVHHTGRDEEEGEEGRIIEPLEDQEQEGVEIRELEQEPENIEVRGLVQELENVEEENSNISARAGNSYEVASTLIICNGGVCTELTAEEVRAIPICTYNNDVCYLDNSRVATQSDKITSVVAGEYCTDSSRSTIYFAMETIVEFNDIVSSSKSPGKNCIKASSQYNNNLFTVGNKIYRVSEASIVEINDKGYYFININKNVLVYSSEIKDYNNEYVLLYKCDGINCHIMEKPLSTTYYTDVTKRIIKYSIDEGKYSFVNTRENTCFFEDNTCTPKYDIAENDFCITADGNLVVAGETIRSRETGKCYMSSSIRENVLAYSHSSTLYFLNSNAASQITTSGYFFAENSRYQSADYRLFNSTHIGITLYGCVNKNCQVYTPQPNVYYFDMLTNYLIQKKDKVWISPYTVGYINVSVNPEEEYIYSYTISESKELLLTKTNKNGYYNTVDGQMYKCDTGIQTCSEIEESSYVLTNSNELFYCIVDSEGEDTECFKRTCTVNEIYYIEDNYYRCLMGSYLEVIRPKTCVHDDVVVINFPLIYTDSFPTNVFKTISNIAKNNHYVPTEKVSRTALETVQGVFTNCTYNVYDDYATYDQICMANHVKLNQDKEPDICSIELLGYTFCTVEEGEDPYKCNPSSAFGQKQFSIIKVMTFIISIIIYFTFIN